MTTTADAERLAHYLRAIRHGCLNVAATLSNTGERRRLEQASQVLSQLVVEAATLPALQSIALAAYRSLPAPLRVAGNASYVSARADAQRLLRTGSQLPGDAALRQLVDIEAATLRQLEAAFKSVNSAVADNASVAAASSLPDKSALGRYLSTVLHANAEVQSLDTVALGYSKLTLLATVALNGQAAPDLIIRMDRPFNYLETTVVDECPVLQQLYSAGVRVPKPWAMEASSEVLGQPFLVQSRVAGRNIGSHFMPPPRSPELCKRFAEQLAAIHSVSVASLGKRLRGAQLDAKEQLQADIDKSYGHWTALQTDVPILEAAFLWLRQHIDEGIGQRTLVHGDFSLSNLLIDEQDEISAILDWEFAGLGNPAADLGWFYTGASRLESWEYFLQAYRHAGGTPPDARQLDFYVLLGALRLAVMNYQVSVGFESGRNTELKNAAVAAAFQREVTLRVSEPLVRLLARSS
jgi:aminoglycoside phosphotransferase (APT) family kinase protein